MTITNLTPHTLNVILPNGTCRAIPSSGVARCAQTSVSAGDHDGIQLVHTQYGTVTGLPEPIAGVLYVVSALVRAAVPERMDVASPGDLVRNDAGAVIGCRNLIMNTNPVRDAIYGV